MRVLTVAVILLPGVSWMLTVAVILLPGVSWMEMCDGSSRGLHRSSGHL